MARAGNRAAQIGTVVAVCVLAAGCSGSPDSSSPSPSAVPNGEPVGSQGADTTVSEATGLVLAEVGFSPQPFVEIANAGDDAVDAEALRLVADGRPVDVTAEERSLGQGDRLLVTLDEAGDLDAAEGNVFLYDGEELLLDSVVWGPEQGGAVSMAIGDFVPANIDAGSTIGRPPGADQPLMPSEWVLYPPPSASPGEPNPVPTVAVLLPMDGAILEASDATLAWYPVRGAASYRVQVATETTFADVVRDETVAEATIDVGELDPGTYVWRVRAVGADGDTSAQSSASTVTLGGAAAKARPAELGNPLNVPFLAQRKDTTMLLLESPHEQQPMAWDAPHHPPSGMDPADNKNCAIAMIAMINRFYGGDLSQDRIGYEIFKDRKPGPEEDLNYGYGLTSGGDGVDQTLKAFQFALGAPVGFTPAHESMDDVWATIVNAIDSGQPVAGAGTRHGYVVKGYEVRNGRRLIIVNDPARGTYKLDLDTPGANPQLISLWTMPEQVNARKQEPGVTKDADGDKVVDFDETERFRTDPGKKDTDVDEVNDKQDIASGVFDPLFGYAFLGGRGRDYDSDGVPTETDPDSDSGGCDDGDEDENGDGHQTGEETWNFDSKDDVCGDLSGTITWTLHETRSGPGDERASSNDLVTLNVRFDEQDGEWVDSGSSYTWTGSSRYDTNPGDDPEAGYCNEHHHTSTTTGGEDFATALVSHIFVDVLAESDEVYVSSWVAGELKGHKETGTLTSDGGPTRWCELVPSDHTQGGGSTLDSQAEWGQVPRCLNHDEAVVGTISDDGRTVVFECEETETYEPVEGATGTVTMSVTGQLTFAKGQ